MSTGGLATADFDHFVLTRFNVRQGDARADEAWLRHRLRYFEDLCHRSVSAQTVDTFTWLVYFDAERDPWFQEEIDRLSAGVFEPVWVDGAMSITEYANAVADRSDKGWVITTRMDNDDAIARDFIEGIQREFRNQEFGFLNFPSGLQLTEDGRLFRWSDPAGPFISLIEKRVDGGLPQTVYIDGHHRLERYGPITQVRAHPMWVQAVHGQNIANAVKGIRTAPHVLDEHFDLKWRAAQVSRLSLGVSQVVNGATLAVRVALSANRMKRAATLLGSRIFPR
jgi:hypothetical protein